jgi:hypothetical protein
MISILFLEHLINRPSVQYTAVVATVTLYRVEKRNVCAS